MFIALRHMFHMMFISPSTQPTLDFLVKLDRPQCSVCGAWRYSGSCRFLRFVGLPPPPVAYITHVLSSWKRCTLCKRTSN